MLSADEINALRDAATELTQPIVEYLLKDIAQRVAKAGQLTATAQYEIWKLQELGVSQRETKKHLKKLLKVSNRELRQLLTQSAEAGYRYDLNALPQVQKIAFEKNEVLQQIVSSAVKLAQDDLTNITQTLGMVDPYGHAQPLQEVYRSCMDYAFMQVSTGAADYNTAIRQATKNLAEKGVRYIDYKSGVHTSLEAAVRRSVMGGMGLMQEQISKRNHDDLGANGWEISAHAASAPDHEPIQGRQYSDQEYEALNNSLVRRIGTLNCGHAAYPIILGVSIPKYTPEQLEKFRTDNEKGITYNGRHYTAYEATQRQRRLEAGIRRQRRRILVDEGTGDEKKLQADRIKLRLLDQEYDRFSKAAGLRKQYERMETVGYNWKQEREVEKAFEQVKQKSDETQKKVNMIKIYSDVTEQWRETAKPNSHIVEDAQEVTVKENTYKVDGHNVVLDYSPHEKEIAELLEKEFGGEIKMLPRVNNPQGVSTPDYLFRGEGYDLKTIGENAGDNTIFNRIKKAKWQSNNFVIDTTMSGLSEKTISAQIEKLFARVDTKWLEKIIVVSDGKVVRVAKRKK